MGSISGGGIHVLCVGSLCGVLGNSFSFDGVVGVSGEESAAAVESEFGALLVRPACIGGVLICVVRALTTSVVTGVFGDVTSGFCGLTVGDLGLPITVGICGAVVDGSLVKSTIAVVLGVFEKTSALVIGDCEMTDVDFDVL